MCMLTLKHCKPLHICTDFHSAIVHIQINTISYNASGQIIMIFYAIAMFVGHCPIFVQITGQQTWLDMQLKVVYLPG